MAANIAHVFVRATSEQVEKAWRRFSRRPASNIYLIPAEGGCFVVAAPRRKQGALPISWPPQRRHGRVSRRDLERFRDQLEGASR